MKTKILLIITCFVMTSVFSQVNLNEYKYVIVSKKFDFLKEEDQYQLNSLSKFLFNKYGFEAYMEGEDYPQELKDDRCLVLRADAFSNPNILRTKSRLFIQLIDCNDKVVYTSAYGESLLKEFDKAYQDAMREVFKHIAKLKHNYVSKESKPLKEENKVVIVKDEQSDVLYAKAISEGFEVVDASSQVIMVLIASPIQDFYIVKDKNATVFKEEGVWYYAENNSEKRVLNLKF